MNIKLLLPSPDMSIAGILIAFLGIGILIFIVISVIEGVLLRLLGWGTLGTSLKHSFLINAISTFAGIFVLPALAYIIDKLMPPTFDFVSGTAFLFSWLGTILIEGLILLRLKRHSAKKSWRMVSIINMVSYLLLLTYFLSSGYF